MKQPLIIYCDQTPIDVIEHYRTKHGMELPPTPTMSGKEIREASDNQNHQYQLYVKGVADYDLKPVDGAEAIPLRHGMEFFTIPPAAY